MVQRVFVAVSPDDSKGFPRFSFSTPCEYLLGGDLLIPDRDTTDRRTKTGKFRRDLWQVVTEYTGTPCSSFPSFSLF